ncbi:hypothetical protein ABT160_42570 [Streptomyces sp. NPDC001941]|uniref:hypothetical protein n=1 Tax=Streptomyces sp. NPDC001941 TaxID=3154659 RepID=UPI00331770E8
MVQTLEHLVVRHTCRVPLPAAVPPAAGAPGAAAARRFDVALMSVGFKLSGELLRRLSGLSAAAVDAVARGTLDGVRELVGDHVRHNTYFVGFPQGVPDTADFWAHCVARALAADESTRADVLAQLERGSVDLLSLPEYGRYQHPYEAVLAAHDELVAGADDRVTLLHPGGPVAEEAGALYLALAGAATPLGEEGLRDLAVLASACADRPQPEAVPVRESRAVINRERVEAGAPPLLDTVTDVLRLACALSAGDVTLTERTRFRSLPRRQRRTLLEGLHALVARDPARLADVHAHAEAFKRLGERLHPHEYPALPGAAEVFAVARGERAARTLESRVEELLSGGDPVGAAGLLAVAPGRLLRAVDRLLRECGTDEERAAVAGAAERAVPGASARVLLSVREHLLNRAGDGAGRAGDAAPRRRVFVNRKGRGAVADDTRAPLPAAEAARLARVLDEEVARRLPGPGHLLVDPDVLDVALPLSGKATTGGLGVLPRGSVSPVDGELLRFFVYWKEAARRTDFDLAALVLDDAYATVAWLSYTALKDVEGVHSGDVTEAPEGASEFIDLRLGAVRGTFVVPQVNVYAGEGFEEVEESFFGFMLRGGEQAGRPFEPRTVRMKSDLRGAGRVALPLVFRRGDDGRWRALWLHQYLRGYPSANRVEDNRLTVAELVRASVEREYLTVRHLTDLLARRAAVTTVWDGGAVPDGPVTYVGLERPEGLHPDSRVFTRENLRDLVPE